MPKPEHLIAMKLRALQKDPTGPGQNLEDISKLAAIPGVDEDEFRDYFEALDLGHLLNARPESSSRSRDSRQSHPRERADAIIDVKSGLPETTPQDVEALRAAAKIPLGADRAARWLIALGRSVSSETLAKRPNSTGEPFCFEGSGSTLHWLSA